MLKRALLCLTLLFAGSAPAQDPKPPVPPAPTPAPTPAPVPALAITGPSQIVEGQLAVLSLTGGKATVAWLVRPKASTFVCGQQCAFTAGPGSYDVIALAVSGGQPVILESAVEIVSSTPTPPTPTPTPGPTPPPTPTPTSGPLWAIAVFDTSKQIGLPVGQLAIWNSQALAANLKSVSVTLNRYDVGNPNISSAAWKAALAGLPLPALVVVDQNRVAVSSGPLPADESALIAKIKSLRGAN